MSGSGGAGPAAYGQVWADDYDELYEHRDDPAEVVGLIASVVPPGGRILEFGVGTGRLAVPLAAAGFEVTGVDAAPEMLRRLAARPNAAAIRAVEGDFTTVDAGEPAHLVLIAFSTLFLVPSQHEQLACLANAVKHLVPGGHLVLEAFVPDHSRWTRHQNVSIGHLDSEGVTLKMSQHDPVEQRIVMQDVLVGPSGTSLRPNVLRYAWPAELDAMALANGLRLVRRSEDWAGAPFTSSSTSHVSLYQHTPAGSRP